jgi:hypothetical protein
MKKQNNLVKNNISGLGKGILDTLEAGEENNNVITTSEETAADGNKTVNTPSSKIVKEQRSKRSFMLKEITTQRLSLLKLCKPELDLSSIVEEAINKYFEENKSSIENVLSLYDKVK